jgi:hypothetical protein
VDDELVPLDQGKAELDLHDLYLICVTCCVFELKRIVCVCVLNASCFIGRQPKPQSLFAAMKNNIKVYFQESSIHGFPWIVNRDLHIVEKLLWVVSLVISFICCGLLIYKIGVKFEEDAMVTYTSDTAIEVVDVS